MLIEKNNFITNEDCDELIRISENKFVEALVSSGERGHRIASYVWIDDKESISVKLKEITYIHAEGYPAAEMKHGPIALVDENLPVVFVATKDLYYEKVVSNIQEIKARKGQIIAVATEGDAVLPSMSDNVMFVPDIDEVIAPLLSVIPLQLLSYYVGVAKGIDVDKPRNLAKSVTVE